MANAKIIYPSQSIQSGGAVLAFKWPASKVSAYDGKAVRADDYSTYGLKQSNLQRIDHFISFDMPRIENGADSAAWQAFLDWALQGQAFDFYVDSALAGYVTCYSEGTAARLEYRAPGLRKLSGVKFRQVIAA